MNLDKLESIARAATPGPWLLATSNSWRRFVTKFDMRSVCEPVTYSERDRHPDLHFPNGGQDGPDAQFMTTFSPDVALAMIAVCRAAKIVQAHFDEGVRPDSVAIAALRTALQSLPKEAE